MSEFQEIRVRSLWVLLYGRVWRFVYCLRRRMVRPVLLAEYRVLHRRIVTLKSPAV